MSSVVAVHLGIPYSSLKQIGIGTTAAYLGQLLKSMVVGPLEVVDISGSTG